MELDMEKLRPNVRFVAGRYPHDPAPEPHARIVGLAFSSRSIANQSERSFGNLSDAQQTRHSRRWSTSTRPPARG